MLKTVAPWIVVTGLDGSGKTGLVRRLAQRFDAHSFRLPYHDFVKEGLRRSGDGTQFGDVHTDRLILAADARLTHYRIRDWRRQHALLVSQRAWMDNFVFAAVQGCSYAETDALLGTRELERPSAAIFLIAEPEIGFSRICNDPDGDKFETREFMREQYKETLRLYRGFQEAHPDLAAFHNIPAHLIDTSRLDEEAVFRAAESFLLERKLCGV
jgi:thymidylate kinase